MTEEKLKEICNSPANPSGAFYHGFTKLEAASLQILRHMVNSEIYRYLPIGKICDYSIGYAKELLKRCNDE